MSKVVKFKKYWPRAAFKRQQARPQARIDSLIGADTKVEGNLHFQGGMRIDGQVNGDIIGVGEQSNTLVLSEHAQVNGNIRVSHLVTNGAVHGAIYASEYLELQHKAKVTGEVHYKKLDMQLGAVVDGCLVHNAETSNIVPLKVNE